MFTKLINNKDGFFNKSISLAVIITFIFSLLIPLNSYAQGLNLPVPGSMITSSPASTPALLKGLTIDPNDPFKFDFILDVGDKSNNSESDLNPVSGKLINYFFAALTVPEKDLWVNLSPYEEGRIIKEGFGQTEMGRDLLAQDYLLKQLTASLMYPEDDIGKVFWDKIYDKVYERFGTTDVPINTFNKVWIMPDKAVVYEHENTAFVMEGRMKVLLERDYVALSNNIFSDKFSTNKMDAIDIHELDEVSSAIVKEIILPEIEKEINEGKNFEMLRQVYHSLILAAWFKKNLKESFLGQQYADQNKVKGIDEVQDQVKQEIYEQYLEAFKKGAFNYIKEEFDENAQMMIPRKYFSGGFATDGNFVDEVKVVNRRDGAMFGKLRNWIVTVRSFLGKHIKSVKVRLKILNDGNREVVVDSSDDEVVPGEAAFKEWYDPRKEYLLQLQEGLDQLETDSLSEGFSDFPVMMPYLINMKNDLARTVQTLQTINNTYKEKSAFLVEIAGGNTNVALAIADQNKDFLVWTTDEYDSNPETASEKYLPEAVSFEDWQLSAQKSELDNILVSRAQASMLLAVPDNSIDYLLLVNPPRAAIRELTVLLRDFAIAKKFKKGGKIIFKASEVIEGYLELMEDAGTVEFEAKEDFKMFGVDLYETADWKEEDLKGALYVGEVSPDTAMMTANDVNEVKTFHSKWVKGKETPKLMEGKVGIIWGIKRGTPVWRERFEREIASEIVPDNMTGINCVATTVGEFDKRIWPRNLDEYRHMSEHAAMDMFYADHGFRKMEDAADLSFEQGKVKVVLYALSDGKQPYHVAVQSKDGMWISKMSGRELIKVESATQLEGSALGQIVTVYEKDIDEDYQWVDDAIEDQLDLNSNPVMLSAEDIDGIVNEKASSAEKEGGDEAMFINPYKTEQDATGGIDFNIENMGLETRGDGAMFVSPQGGSLPFGPIEGIVPIIINISPANNLPMLLGLSNTPGSEYN